MTFSEVVEWTQYKAREGTLGQLKETNVTSAGRLSLLLWKYLYTEKLQQRRDKIKALGTIYSPAAMSLKQDRIYNMATIPAFVRVIDSERK